MPTFAPQGILHIGTVPFDNSYKHTVLKNWATEEAMAGEFAQQLNNTYTEDTYTYIRLNNSIRVNFNAEKLYRFNYCMFQNANYTNSLNKNKWFYAFITEINYINESCTELVIEIDVIHSFWFEFHLEQCFVEREHVDSDEIGEHLVPEPSFPVEYEYADLHIESMKPRYVVLSANAYPRYNHLPGAGFNHNSANGTRPLSGSVTGGYAHHMYQNFMNACTYIIYDLYDSVSMSRFWQDIRFFNTTGGAETLSDAFLIPADCVANTATDIIQLPIRYGEPTDVDYEQYVYTLRENAPVAKNDKSITQYLNFRSYIPKNNKMYIYPYYYIEFGDYSGRIEEYRYEFFTKAILAPHTVHFIDSRVINGECIGYISPKDYMGITSETPDADEVGTYYVKPFTYDYGNKISWTYSTFENYMAQNQLSNTIAVLGGIASVAGGVAGGMLKQAEGVTNEIASASQKASNMLSWGAGNPTHYGGNRTMRVMNEEFRNLPVLGGLATLGATAANIDRMKHIPNESRGNIAGNSKFQQGYGGYYYASKRLRPEFAKIIDDYMTMYGYEVDCIKVPEIFSRTGWNFVKCANSDNHGAVPAEFLKLFNDILNSGITFWHNWNIGDYSISNSIVS